MLKSVIFANKKILICYNVVLNVREHIIAARNAKKKIGNSTKLNAAENRYVFRNIKQMTYFD